MSWLGHEQLHLEQVDSTSDEVWRQAARSAPHGFVVRADRQSAGRGRQGREWIAGAGDLMASWLMRFASTPRGATALSIVQGIGIARELDRHAPGRIRLKWPNDLLLDGRKVGGLLLESRVLDGVCVVSGLGLNLRTPAGGWGPLQGRAIAMDTVADVQAGEMLDALLSALEPVLDAFIAHGPDAMLAEWPRWSALDGAQIAWESGGRECAGRVLGLSGDGGLRVALATGGEEVLYSGEVHLRESR